MSRESREFRRLERACRERAAAASLPSERDAFLKVAEDYRAARAELVRKALKESRMD